MKIKNRQYFICPFRVDGFDDKTNTIYEFLGDYYHGNPKKFKSNDVNKICKKSYKQLLTETMNRLNGLKLRGYNVNYIWESDWKKYKNGIDNTPNIIQYNQG